MTEQLQRVIDQLNAAALRLWPDLVMRWWVNQLLQLGMGTLLFLCGLGVGWWWSRLPIPDSYDEAFVPYLIRVVLWSFFMLFITIFTLIQWSTLGDLLYPEAGFVMSLIENK